MSGEPVTVAPEWLRLRESADAAARSRELVDLLAAALPPAPVLVHDLACGTGAMGRWLAPLLPVPQRWVLHDVDPVLLAYAAKSPPVSADGGPVAVETRCDDVTRLDLDDLSGASLVTSSALLDLLTVAELDRLLAAVAAARCPFLVALSVAGRVELLPADPLDAGITAAFNAHQRRDRGRGALLGPDAVAACADRFADLGYDVHLRETPWRLSGADDAALVGEWLTGWVGAACEQDPGLGRPAREYLPRRLHDAATGDLGVVVQHVDLLALPR